MTPDGRYIIVRGRLWRTSNPALSEADRQRLVADLMKARRGLRGIDDAATARDLRKVVNQIKRDLGERGPVWWGDGSPDLNRHLIDNTPYRDWYRQNLR